MSKSNTSAGIFFYSNSTNRFLFLLRNDKDATFWGIPGGKLEKDETIIQGLERECIEETQYFPTNPKLIPIQKFVNNAWMKSWEGWYAAGDFSVVI